jgi:hypothetical protein
MFRLQGVGGSSTWEKPSNYKNPEVDAFDYINKNSGSENNSNGRRK